MQNCRNNNPYMRRANCGYGNNNNSFKEHFGFHRMDVGNDPYLHLRLCSCRINHSSIKSYYYANNKKYGGKD